MNRLPLKGVRIIDSTYVVAMPYACGIMTDLGAEVIKIEGPSHVDNTRGPADTSGRPDNQPGNDHWNRAMGFNEMNRGKRSLTLDLRQPEGRELFTDLVKVSDIVVENFTPRVMRRWELDYPNLKKIKPDIIMLSNTGYGYSDGPYSSYPGQATTLEGTHGLTAITGYRGGIPSKAGRSYVDFLAAWFGLFAIASALHYRNKTGKGQWIDLAMYQLGVYFTSEYIMDWTANKRIGQRIANRHKSRVPQGCYPCAGDDQWCVISVGDDQEWIDLCQALDKSDWLDDPRFKDALNRHIFHDDLDKEIADWTRRHTKYQVMEILQESGVPAGPVFDFKDASLSPQSWSRGFLEKVTSQPDRGMGTRMFIGRPYQLSKTPLRVRDFAPALGEGNNYFLRDVLGVGEDRIERLGQQDIIHTIPTLVRDGRVNTGQGARMAGLGPTWYDPDYKANLGI